MSEEDSLRRFLFEDAPLRGHWVRLSRSWIEAREHQLLSPPVMELLGQSLAAATLLSASLKFEGTLTLQLAGSRGAVAMLVAQATDRRTLRGMVQMAGDDAADDGNGATPPDGFPALIDGGRLVVSVERGSGAAPWQGIVPLEDDSLSACLARYFAVSEQLPTAVVLAADARHAAGLLLQRLPLAEGTGEEAQVAIRDLWEEAVAMLGTLGADELLACEPGELLRRLFGTHDLRLFEAEPVQFACRCSRERVATMLQSLGRAEVDAIITEQGAVTVTCEFCRKPYRFDAVDAAQLFVSPAGGASTSLN